MTEESSGSLLRGLERFSLRLTAMGFVVLILGGNLWLILELLGQTLPLALVWSAGAGTFMVAIGGLGQLLAWLGRMKSNTGRVTSQNKS
jgi:hypothetical protein